MKGRIEINRGPLTSIAQSGIGYIVIPDDNTRKEYIDTCYRTMTVTIQGGYGYGYIDNVKILSEVLQNIKFPLKSSDKGTAVLWIRENFSNRPIIIGIIENSDYTNLLQEGQNHFFQKIENKIVEIFEDANNGILHINVLTDKDNPATIKIRAISGTTESIIKLETDGNVNVTANNVSINSKEDFNIALKDSLNKEIVSISGNKENFNIDSKVDINIKSEKKINLNSGKESMVLGDSLKKILEELCIAIQKITVMTSTGTSSIPQNISDFENIKNKLNNILSEKSNLE